MIVLKDEDEEDEKVEKIQVDGEILHLIALKGKMELKFTKNTKKTEKNKKIKSKVNLILSYNETHIFILDPQIGPQAFRHTHCTLGKSVFFNMKKGPTQGSICFKLVPGLLVPGPLSKVALIDGVFHVSHAGSCQWT
jgi:hypothetical protein